MGKNKNAPQTETRTQRRDRAQVLVRLDQVIPEVRAEIERDWDERERRARDLRRIRGSQGHTDAHAFPTEGETMRGATKRGKDAPVPLPKKVRKIHPEVVAAEEADTTASDGTMDDGRAEMGQFVPGPDRETVDVGGVPTSRRRR